MSYTETDVDGLGAKLDAIVLSDGERAALHALLTFAAQYPGDVDGLTLPAGDVQLKQVLASLLLESELI